MRFQGTVAPLIGVDIGPLRDWVQKIPHEDWPQQKRLADGKVRPAMQTDLAWHGFGQVASFPVMKIMAELAGCSSHTWMLSAVMDGHDIPPHVDRQAPDWVCRVHVPLLTNDQSQFIVGGREHHLEPGMSYMVNTEAEHSVVNRGPTPRVHFMFDVRRTMR